MGKITVMPVVREAGRKAEQEPANTAQHNHDAFGSHDLFYYS